MSERDQALKAANDLYKGNSERVDAATCRRAYDTLKRLAPKVGATSSDDSNVGFITRAPKAAPSCFAAAGDCATAWQVFQEQFGSIPSHMRQGAFEDNVPACKGKVAARSSARDELLKAIDDLYKGTMKMANAATCRRAYDTVRRLGPTVKPEGAQDPAAIGVRHAPVTAMRCFAANGDCATAKKMYFELYPTSAPHLFATMNYECQGK